MIQRPGPPTGNAGRGSAEAKGDHKSITVALRKKRNTIKRAGFFIFIIIIFLIFNETKPVFMNHSSRLKTN